MPSLRARLAGSALASSILVACGATTEDSSQPDPDAAVDAGVADAAPIEAPVCDPPGYELKAIGNVGGEPFQSSLPEFFPRETSSSPAGTRLTWAAETTVSFDYYGGIFSSAQPEYGGPAVAAEGHVYFPRAGSHAGKWYCTGEGSVVQFGADYSVTATLRDFSLIGACPGGTPVSGEITLCYADSTWAPQVGCEPSTIVSTLSGAAFDAPIAFGATSTRWEEDIALADVALLDSGAVVVELAGIEHEVEGIATAAISHGVFLVPQGQPDGGAVYCIGEGSEVEYRTLGGGVEPLRGVFKNVTRIGTCGDEVSGEIGVCVDVGTQ